MPVTLFRLKLNESRALSNAGTEPLELSELSELRKTWMQKNALLAKPMNAR